MRAGRILAWTTLAALSGAFVDATLRGAGGGPGGVTPAELGRLLDREAELCRQIERVRRCPAAHAQPAAAERAGAEYRELDRVRDRIRALEHHGW